jgi:hypothetical protein
VRPDLLPRQRGVSYAIGNEFIHLTNGAHYRIVASTRGGARGPANDTVIVDEVRELESFEFIGAAKPTMAASRSPQIVYLSNAGDDASEVLNAIRDRADDDPALAYLEWSAAPDRATDDRRGWLEANPSIGHDPTLLDNLEAEYHTNVLQGTVGIFETEHLCRWVHTVLPPIIRVETWEELRDDGVDPPRRPSLGIAVDPAGRRASAVIAWRLDDGRVAVRTVADERGDVVDVTAFGERLRVIARQQRVNRVAYDSATDAEVAKYFRRIDAVSGSKLTNASSQFVNMVEAHNIRWTGDTLVDDIPWTGRRAHVTPGTWTAVTMSDDHPVTAMLATIRAVWLTSGPRPSHGRLG